VSGEKSRFFLTAHSLRLTSFGLALGPFAHTRLRTRCSQAGCRISQEKIARRQVCVIRFQVDSFLDQVHRFVKVFTSVEVDPGQIEVAQRERGVDLGGLLETFEFIIFSAQQPIESGEVILSP
jgi:hypothetical protein